MYSGSPSSLTAVENCAESATIATPHSSAAMVTIQGPAVTSSPMVAAQVPLTAMLYQFYRALQARGLGREGHHALIKALEHLAGIKVGPIKNIQD